MEEASSEPVLERRPDSAIAIQRADLEDLIGQVVCRETASQQAGPSSNSLVEGERLGVVIGFSPGSA